MDRHCGALGGPSGQAAAPLGAAATTSQVAVVDVIDADDIVLAEVAAGLHLDQLEIDLARIGQPVFATNGQIDRLVLVRELDFAIDRHFGRAAHHNPVFGAVIVLLQRQASAGPDYYALDLVAPSLIDALVIAPGPIHPSVLRRLRMPRRF